ncbi:hypothetical protein ACWC98_21325 [Streptomyces goshikiensis]|uniref:hypothetical protein n=1 Tax=Streptomyces sp. NPDC093801 TaxID=3155203 RepID=UPI00344BD9C3
MSQSTTSTSTSTVHTARTFRAAHGPASTWDANTCRLYLELFSQPGPTRIPRPPIREGAR